MSRGTKRTQYDADLRDESKVNATRERIKQLQKSKNETKSGLDIELHPLLKNIGTTPIIPNNHNPLKQNVRKWFDPVAINPYLNQSDMSISSHKPRPLIFNPKGKFISQGDQLREKLKQKALEKQERDRIKAEGLLPDENLGEQFYKPEFPPPVEWWDRPYLRDVTYEHIQDDTRKILDSESQPITSYVQHPVLVPPIWESHNESKPMHLTKQERKRLRKNTRMERHKEKQDRIRLGLDPPPPPKVKLSNLMNVLTNEAIRDPTAVENRVKKEVEQRLEKHLQENESRKLTKEQRHEKIFEQQDKDLSKGLYSAVFKIDSLDNKQNLFKIDINAKQHNLFGICLKNPKFNLIIVEGGQKSIERYQKLLLNRIDWTKNTQEGSDLSKNKCLMIWEGRIKQLSFQKWSIMYSRDDDEAFTIVNKFGMENYWRLASST
ncbi:U4/U5/U6 small nuclear ribonucleoprotein prp3 [Spathaspora sp. JA1]|nr:U4/U5/U6 small nuclear ribonucleoprotein prp3 [Spathaspora sp. JA1]